MDTTTNQKTACVLVKSRDNEICVCETFGGNVMEAGMVGGQTSTKKSSNVNGMIIQGGLHLL